ncbi:hypothetical protein RIF29_30729 [Crotalaria pallida]|uniref:Uncharacterized protein n=1 Tax=Crotalaria pallida TaxID=3830 RepID=A0AAN9EH83_CROPI
MPILVGCRRYGGQLLIAVGRDPNDQYFLLAFGVGLVEVFQELLDGVEHRFCLRHLYNNVKKRFGGGTEIRNLMMGAAKATYEQAWRDQMDELRQVSEASWILKRVREEDVANGANGAAANGATDDHGATNGVAADAANDAAENTPTNEVVVAAIGRTTTATNNPENPSPKRRKGKKICKPKALSQPVAPRRSKSKKCAGVKEVTDLVTKKPMEPMNPAELANYWTNLLKECDILKKGNEQGGKHPLNNKEDKKGGKNMKKGGKE